MASHRPEALPHKLEYDRGMDGVAMKTGVVDGELIPALVRGARETLGDRLVSLVLYGSRARGDARPDSDVDLLVVCHGLPAGQLHRGAELRPVWRTIEREAAARTGGTGHPRISPIYKTPEEAARLVPLYLDMVDDARLLHDRDGFFAGVLEGLRRRLAQLGSRRVPFKGGWYWELKPDARPGEVFEI